MNIQQGFESSILAAHTPNYIVLNSVFGVLKLEWSLYLKETLTGEFNYIPKDGIVEINIEEITKLVYLNVKNYEDPFTYNQDVLFTEIDNYHYGLLNLYMTDGEEGAININLKIINAALQEKECLILPTFINAELGTKQEIDVNGLLNFDLNQNIS